MSNQNIESIRQALGIVKVKSNYDKTKNSKSNHNAAIKYHQIIDNKYTNSFEKLSENTCVHCRNIAKFTGNNQSPINFNEISSNLLKVTPNENLKPLTFMNYYQPIKLHSVINDGHNVVFNVESNLPTSTHQSDHLPTDPNSNSEKHLSDTSINTDASQPQPQPVALTQPSVDVTSQMDSILIDEHPRIVWGPLDNDVYKLNSFHYHWSQNSDHSGSEHIIGEKTQAELHLVHWNSTKFKSFKEAVNSTNGLSVVGIPLKVHNITPYSTISRSIKLKTSLTYDIISKWLSQCKHKGSVHFPTNKEKISLINLLPTNVNSDRCFYSYSGSLTTYPFTENVIWIVFRKAQSIKSTHLESFRALLSIVAEEASNDKSLKDSTIYLGDNFRPTFPVGNRKVLEWSCDPDDADMTVCFE